MFFGESAAVSSTDDAVLQSGSSFPLVGDFYAVQDDVTRGITFDFPDTVAPLGVGFDSDALKKGGFPAGLAPPVPGLLRSTLMSSHPLGSLPRTHALRRFQAAEVPPCLPSDKAFQLEATTVFVKGGDFAPLPADTANQVLDFFENEVEAVVTKVNDKKFTVKAEAQLDGFVCTVKVRIYRQDELRESGLAIELQRRDGDAIAFNSLYRLLSKHLITQGADAGAVADATTTLIPSLGLVAEGDWPQNSLSPLLDAAETRNRELRAEAASGLAAAARDHIPQARAELSTTRALEAFQLLLGTDSFNIVYPIACLLVCLAGQQELEHSFLDHPLRDAMLAKLREQQTAPPVRAQLEQALRCAATQHAPALPRHVVDEVSFALASC